jgi:hypothetical protein
MDAARHGHGREAGMIMAKRPPIHALAGLERINIDRRHEVLASRRHRLDGDGGLSTDGVALLLIARQSPSRFPWTSEFKRGVAAHVLVESSVAPLSAATSQD